MKRLIGKLGRKRLFYLVCIAALISVGIALWPSARCALGQGCNDREYWCSEDCDKACAGATGFGYIDHCIYNYATGKCQGQWFPDEINGTCSNPDNCNLVDVSDEDWRLSFHGGVSYWNVGKCEIVDGPYYCDVVTWERELTCCVGMSEDPPDECEPSYGAPIINTDGLVLAPPFPLVLGQDPDHLGISMSGITAIGGADGNQCGGGGAKITDLKATIALSEESVTWITEELSSRYYNANVIGTYPAEPTSYEVVGLGTSNATITFRFDNPDPGWYNIIVTATQEDGKVTQVVIRVLTAMLDTTGTMP